MNTETTLTEIMETELKEKIAQLERQLSAAQGALEVAETAYKFAAMKNNIIALESYPGFSYLKAAAYGTNLS